MASNLNVGQVTLTGSAQQLTGITGGERLWLKNPGATNTIYIGKDNTVSATTGYPLSPGAQVDLNLINASKVWVIGTAADKLGYLVEVP